MKKNTQVHDKNTKLMNSVQTGKVELRKQLMVSLVSKSNFNDIDNANKFPICLKPLHLIWKLSGLIWRGNGDASLMWIVWSWTFRVIVLFFIIISLFPHIFAGVDSLLIFVEESPYLIVKLSLYGAVLLYQISAIYPLIFCTYYIHKGYLHQILQNLLSIKYVKEEYKK
eukprot:468117_1